jgi:predicted GNAT family acetyltransferase
MLLLRRAEDPAAVADEVADLVRAGGAAVGSVHLGVLHELPPGTTVWVAREAGTVVAALTRVPPHPWVVALRPDRSATELGRAAAGARLTRHEVSGPEGVADTVARSWADAVGGHAQHLATMQAMACRTLVTPGATPGERRRAGADDLDHAVAWELDFHREALPGMTVDAAEVRARLARRIAEGGLHLWRDRGATVATATTLEVGDHARVAMVYVPPELRGRGYARALVAAITAEVLGRGDPEVVLNADVANPISTALYEGLGYVHAGRVTTWRVGASRTDS